MKNKQINMATQGKIMLIIAFMFMSIMLLSFGSSLDSLGVYSQGQSVRISQVCSDATYINLSSISYPSSEVAVSGIEMSSAGNGEFYYDFTDTTQLGRYDVRGISDGCEKTFATYFEVRLTNRNDDLPETIRTISFLLIAFGIAWLLYSKVSRLIGSIVILVLGVGIIRIGGDMGWVGTIVLITGLLMIVYSAFAKPKTSYKGFRR